MADKYTALWVSHSSISAFLECPRAYFLKNIYKDPKSGHKIKLMSPPLALGQAVHEVVESLSEIKTDLRFKESLLDKFDRAWKKVSGKNGGFFDKDTEYQYKTRGEEMIRRVIKNPGPLGELAVKINMDLPHYWLSEEDNIILCGKIDWLKYYPDTNSVEIIDFKTSRHEEGEDSLQLPIYNLLVHNCQNREVTAASYWYLDSNDELTPKKLPDLKESEEKILKIAKRMKLQKSLGKFDCPNGEAGCRACRPYENILRGEAEYVGLDDYKADVYILNKSPKNEGEDSKIL
ncbi:MAG: PD-(D/E)XK nuclease family protein [Candidatus Shapirobacteria bacterium]|jgi:ATP-dependent helicase/DNAse subunit B